MLPAKFELSYLCASVTTMVRPPALNQSFDLLRHVALLLLAMLCQGALPLPPRRVYEVGGIPHGVTLVWCLLVPAGLLLFFPGFPADQNQIGRTGTKEDRVRWRCLTISRQA